MTAILVTGGAGFIGSHACKALAASGYNPVTLDNLERGHEWAVKWGPLERGDITDPKVLQRVFETWRPEAVMHFAAYAYVGESNVEPLKYYANNVGGAVNLLEACSDSVASLITPWVTIRLAGQELARRLLPQHRTRRTDIGVSE